MSARGFVAGGLFLGATVGALLFVALGACGTDSDACGSGVAAYCAKQAGYVGDPAAAPAPGPGVACPMTWTDIPSCGAIIGSCSPYYVLRVQGPNRTQVFYYDTKSLALVDVVDESFDGVAVRQCASSADDFADPPNCLFQEQAPCPSSSSDAGAAADAIADAGVEAFWPDARVDAMVDGAADAGVVDASESDASPTDGGVADSD